MDYGSQDAVTVIGEASDFKIVWLEDFTILNEIDSLFAKVIIASGYLGKDALLSVLEPKVCYCLDRCDISIQSVSELIEAFTLWTQQFFTIDKCTHPYTKKSPFNQTNQKSLWSISLVCVMHFQNCSSPKME